MGERLQSLRRIPIHRFTAVGNAHVLRPEGADRLWPCAQHPWIEFVAPTRAGTEAELEPERVRAATIACQ
jgi:hypothetical protein